MVTWCVAEKFQFIKFYLFKNNLKNIISLNDVIFIQKSVIFKYKCETDH